MTKAEKTAQKLQKMLPNISGITICGYWNGDEKAIHLGDAGEGGTVTVDGIELAAANYWSEDYKEEYYQLGVSHQLVAALEDEGYFAEWHDGGTLLAYEI